MASPSSLFYLYSCATGCVGIMDRIYKWCLYKVSGRLGLKPVEFCTILWNMG